MRAAHDALLRYQVRLERVSRSTARLLVADIEAGLKTVAAELKRRIPEDAPATYARLQALQGELVALREALRSKITGTLSTTLDGVVRTTGRATQDALTGLPVHWSTTEVPVAQLVASATRPFDGKVWTAWGQKLADDTIGRLESELRQAAALGETVADVAKRVEVVAGLSRASAAKLARTAIMDTSNKAMLATYLAFGVERVRFTATLDSSTSLICAGLDGQEFPIGDAPTPPLHPNCRSVLVPIVDLEGLPEGERASEDGPVAAGTTFEQWLGRQSTSFQREYLGDARYRAWKSGLPLGGMATTDRPLSIDELKRLYPEQMKGAA